MKIESVALLEWQERFAPEETCLSQLIHYRWPDGLICPWVGFWKWLRFIKSRCPFI